MSALPLPRLPDGVGPLGLSVLLHVGVFALAVGVAQRAPAPWLEHDAGVAVGSTFDVATEDSTLSSTPSDDASGEVPVPPAEPVAAEPSSNTPAPETPEPSRNEPASDERERALEDSEPGETPAPKPQRTPPSAAPARDEEDANATSPTTSARPNSPSPNSANPPSSASPSGSEGSVGTTGVAARAGNLVDAVTRVLPLAALSVKTWSELPLGAAGESHARLTLDDDGKLVELTTDEKTPERLEHTLRNLRLLLRSGRFQSGPSTALVSRVVVRVYVERALGAGSLDGDGIDKMSAEYAERERPGRAFVTYRSGLQLRFEVRPEDERK